MKDELKKYIELNLEKDKKNKFTSPIIFSALRADMYYDEVGSNEVNNKNIYRKSVSINEYLKDNEKYSSFQTMLFKLIDKKKLKDSDVYNKVNIDRRLFSKIRSDKKYHPSKDTIILLGLSLELNEIEIVELLDSASYSLPKNNYFDLIIRFCFINKIYNVNSVNELLYDYDCKLLNA